MQTTLEPIVLQYEIPHCHHPNAHNQHLAVKFSIKCFTYLFKNTADSKTSSQMWHLFIFS